MMLLLTSAKVLNQNMQKMLPKFAIFFHVLLPSITRLSSAYQIAQKQISKKNPNYLILCKSYVRQLLKYSIQAWPFVSRRHKLFRVSTEKIYEVGLKKLDYADRLNELGLTTLENRRVRGDLIETFKIVTDREKVKMEDFLNVTKLTKPFAVTSLRWQSRRAVRIPSQVFFSQSVVNIWNGLVRTVVSASSVNNFKNRLGDCAERGV